MTHDEVRSAVRAIWSEVLEVPHADQGGFFDLGGHSIAAFQILAKVEAAYGVTVDVDVLFDDPTADEFADHVAAQLTSPATT